VSDFATTTAFGLIRRLAAAGQNSPAIYLLIAEDSTVPIIQNDIAEELNVQLGIELRSLGALEIQPDKLENAFTSSHVARVFLITLNRWVPKLIESLDRNIVLVTNGGPVLLLATSEVAERALVAAPNLRSRLTDILAMTSDRAPA
jgi:hypothetical protein